MQNVNDLSDYTGENHEYLIALPYRLMLLAANATKHPEIQVMVKEINGQPGFVFTFPPDHEGHDSTFHAPPPIEYEVHTRTAQYYVEEVEAELGSHVARKDAYNNEVARGKAILASLSPDDLAALKLVL